MSQEDLVIDLRGKSIFIAIPCYGGLIPIDAAVALSDTVIQLHKHGTSFAIASERGNGLVTCVRNDLVKRFLESEFEYIFWLDDDIIFTPQDFLEVFAYATLNKCTAATYPTRSDKPRFYLNLIDGKYILNEHGLLECKGLGLGFTCMHRSLLEELANTKESYATKEGVVTKNVFSVGVKNGEYIGEDIGFFSDLYDLGHKVYVHHTVQLKHSGRKDYDARLVLDIKEK